MVYLSSFLYGFFQHILLNQTGFAEKDIIIIISSYSTNFYRIKGIIGWQIVIILMKVLIVKTIIYKIWLIYFPTAFQ